jgi:acyl phosphate:glycerol-3-phosphate acyltransferase
MRNFIFVAFVSYLIGSISFGYLLVRAFRGADIRQSGSGNIGATNVARTSPLLGVLTLALDAAKGLAAVLFALLLSRADIMARVDSSAPSYPEHSWSAMPSSIYARCVLAAFFAIVGHMFPVWLKFRGGKGVATSLGSFLLLAPKSILCIVGVFILVVAATRYVSLGSMMAAAAFPLLVLMLHDFSEPGQLVLILAASLLILIKHRRNISRLLAGSESRLGASRG